MSSRLVELIVLNLGLEAGVINVECFTILVLMALITTFMTSPLIRAVYPQRLWLSASLSQAAQESQQVAAQQQAAAAQGEIALLLPADKVGSSVMHAGQSAGL
jgi:hypothetical protein